MTIKSSNGHHNHSYIVIPVHNRRLVTLKCLKNLREIGCFERFSVIVIDDGSADGTSEAIASNFPEVILLKGSGQLWWSGAVALGMKHAYKQDAKYIIWLNDDCLVKKGTFEDLIEFCRSKSMAIVGSQGHEVSNSHELSFGGKTSKWHFPLNYKLQEFPINKITQCDMLSGNLVCFPRSAIDSCGYPDFESFPHYGGDTVFFQALKRKGFKLFIDTRKSAQNIMPSNSSSNFSNWFTAVGSPWIVINLLTRPQTSLYWRLYYQLNVNQYGLLGFFLFLLKYFPILVRVLIITTLRIAISIETRTKLSEIKKHFLQSQKNATSDS